MGDRVNVKIVYKEWHESQNFQPIYFYSHWGGHRMAETVRQALLRRQRWDDDAYLARIIFSEIIRYGSWDGDVLSDEAILRNLADETGYGISPFEGDQNRATITVDMGNQTVDLGNGNPIPFEAFIKMTREEVKKLHLGSDLEDDDE